MVIDGIYTSVKILRELIKAGLSPNQARIVRKYYKQKFSIAISKSVHTDGRYPYLYELEDQLNWLEQE